jgi:hypothetical protein
MDHALVKGMQSSELFGRREALEAERDRPIPGIGSHEGDDAPLKVNFWTWLPRDSAVYRLPFESVAMLCGQCHWPA